MKKILSVILALAILCLSAFPCFALWNGRHYKLPLTRNFSETETGDGYAIWENKETGSKIEIYMDDNTKKLFYLDAEEETQKEFAKTFIEERQTEAYGEADSNGYNLEYGEPKYGEVKFNYVSGFSITSETTRTSLDKGKTDVFDSDFYFFSTKDLVVQFRCELMTEEDKTEFEKTLNDFEMDSPLLTAQTAYDSYPSPLILLVPLAIIILIVIIAIVVKKKRKTNVNKAEAKEA